MYFKVFNGDYGYGVLVSFSSPKGPCTQIVYTLGLKVVPILMDTLGPKHTLFGYMDKGYYGDDTGYYWKVHVS